jgi:NTE family protein
MTIEDFTLNAEVVNIIDDLSSHYSNKKFEISDIIDDLGHQYVDLVQEGGGVLGVALLGYTYVLEEMGIRFLNIGGTSAGAINALLLAAVDKPSNKKTLRILEIIANKNLNDFVDGDNDAKDFINVFIKKKITLLKLIFKGAQVIDNFREDLGLNPGENFNTWLKNTIETFGIQDTASLERRMLDLPDSLRAREIRKDLINSEHFNISARLAIIAAEVNTETKVEFPRMRELFYKDVDKVHPADFVRASMSIPLFFKPFVIEDLPRDEESIKQWKRLAAHRGGPPERAMFVDGGVMSNFPIDVFHRVGLPSRPTLGVKLGIERCTNKNIREIGDLLYGCFNAARNLRDFEFIHKNPDYKNLVSFIDTNDYSWIDFNVSDKTKVDLFVEGARAAKSFLQHFDWKAYKKTRNTLKSSVYNVNEIDAIITTINSIFEAKKEFNDPDDIFNLKERFSSLNKRINAHVLWIDDKSELIDKERTLLNLLGVQITLVSSTEEAKEVLKNDFDAFDFVISDISREENYDEGINFTSWLSAVYPRYKRKVIFYIVDLDLSRGVPPYAFGITDSSIELLHLILDLSVRD